MLEIQPSFQGSSRYIQTLVGQWLSILSPMGNFQDSAADFCFHLFSNPGPPQMPADNPSPMGSQHSQSLWLLLAFYGSLLPSLVPYEKRSTTRGEASTDLRSSVHAMGERLPHCLTHRCSRSSAFCGHGKNLLSVAKVHLRLRLRQHDHSQAGCPGPDPRASQS